MSEDEVARLREENAKLVARDQEWWRAACDLFNADEGTPAEAAALGDLVALKTGCGWSDVPEPVAKLLCDQRDAALAEKKRLREENERLKKLVLQRLAPHAVATWRERLAFKMMESGWYEAAALVRESSEWLDKEARDADYARQRLAELQAEIGRLREALKPFAAVAAHADGCTVDGLPITDETLLSRYEVIWCGDSGLKLGDCRRAAELLAGSPAPT